MLQEKSNIHLKTIIDKINLDFGSPEADLRPMPSVTPTRILPQAPN